MHTQLASGDLERLRNTSVFLSVSGGKDSTAAGLYLREMGVAFTPMFADTGWEHPDTLEYVCDLERVFGPIAWVGRPGGMRQLVRDRHGFPARIRRFCTSELKRIPLALHHWTRSPPDRYPVVVTGIRSAESASRARMPPWELVETHIPGKWTADGKAFQVIEWTWRPLLHWTLDDVVAIHRRHGVRPNPLYLRGFKRVGCFPCIMAGKDELRRIANESPEVIDDIEAMELELTASESERTGDSRLRSFFLDSFTDHGERKSRPISIRDRVAWAHTAHGGVQKLLDLDDPDDEGCGTWGLCESDESGFPV